MKKNLRTVLLSLLVLGSCTLLTYLEQGDETAYLIQYCDNVSDGTWPNFKELDLETTCKNN